MKKLLVFLLSLMLVCSVAVVPAFATSSGGLEEIYNLAGWKFDWATDGVGYYELNFDEEEGLSVGNFNTGSSLYAAYKANKVNSFDIHLNANFSLTVPEGGTEEDEEFAFFQISSKINKSADDEHFAAYACPWYNDGVSEQNAWIGISWENMNGVPYLDIMLYYAIADEGYGVNNDYCVEVGETAHPNFLDGQYHDWDVSFKAVNGTANDGMQIDIKMDGTTVKSEFLSNNVDFGLFPGEYPISSTSGYIGFWAGSTWPGTSTSETTNCFVKCKEFSITNTDNNNTTPYTRCERPEDVTVNSGISLAPTTTGTETSADLANFFTYEGNGTIDYTAEFVSYSGEYADRITLTEGDTIGTITNGVWKWTAYTPGRTRIKFTANTSTGETASVELAVRVNGDVLNEPVSGGSGGCGSSIGVEIASIGVILTLVAGALAIKKAKQN